MREIVVLSGKGGTGKTSFVASFASLAGKQLVLGDCDVDAANLALLLPGHDRTNEPFYAGTRARVNATLCTGCGECAEVCRYDAISINEESIAVPDDHMCEGCRSCSLVCPENAISYKNNRCGTLYRRKTAFGPLIHAELGIAQDNSGKLVTEVRERARAVAKEHDINTILLDGPPGIGCPVHAAMGGASLVVAVTEPTPSGLHDLERLLELCGHFKLKVAIVVNKYDLNEDLSKRVFNLAGRKGAMLMGHVPFSSNVPRALAMGDLPIVVPSINETLLETWKRIDRVISKK